MKVYFLLIFVLLTGCDFFSKPLNVTTSNSYKYVNTKFGYDIIVPKTATGKNTREDSYAGFGTYSILKDDPRPEDFQMKILAGSELPANTPCSPSITGASYTTPLTTANGKAEWGKVDVIKRMKEGYIPPFETDNIKCGGTPSAYALCSEKNGKTVVICINQQKDNVELAKQIFDSFRWIK